MQRLSATEVAALLKQGYTYVDVRTPEEFAAVRVPGSINIPLLSEVSGQRQLNGKFVQQVQAAFPNSKQPLVVGCATGHRSAAAVSLLQAKYSNLVDAAGGISGWLAAGLPVDKGTATK